MSQKNEAGQIGNLNKKMPLSYRRRKRGGALDKTQDIVSILYINEHSFTSILGCFP
jgi:predicted DNA-binding protein (UPF0278 family)